MTSKISNYTILLVSADPSWRTRLTDALLESFETVLSVGYGEEALRMSDENRPDLVLAGLHLPDVDGVSMCERLRNNSTTRHIPVIIYGDGASCEEKIHALQRGADDFIDHGTSDPELIARISSKIRRMRELREPAPLLVCGNLSLDLDRAEVLVGRLSVIVSVLELRLLHYFLENAGRVLSRAQILEAVWKDTAVSDRNVDSHVAALRRKLQGWDHCIKTLYGAGYIIKKP